MEEEVLERFLQKITIKDDCWIWSSTLDKDGYGKFWYQNYNWRCTQLIYIHCFGVIPIFRKDVIRHICPNKSCVNPLHLEIGSYSDNNGKDKIRDGTLQRGERHGHNVLSEKQVLEIRSSDKSSRRLANDYGVSRGAVRHILKRRSWNWL
jgi:hypothetical protein